MGKMNRPTARKRNDINIYMRKGDGAMLLKDPELIEEV
jgi:hypothetical protein